MTPNDREQKVTALIDKLCLTRKLKRSEWITIIRERTPAAAEHLFELARAVRIHHYGHDIYIRGLIEFTNYCPDFFKKALITAPTSFPMRAR